MLKRQLISLIMTLVMTLVSATAFAAHFASPGTSATIMHVAGNLTIEGAAPQVGDEVAVFDASGNPAGPIGLLVFDGTNLNGTLYPDTVINGDVPSTPAVKEGAAAGEGLSIKVWSASRNKEYSGSSVTLASTSAFVGFGYLQTALPLTFASSSFAELDITAASLAQTIGPISFSPASVSVGGSTTASASATSGLGVTFSSTTPGICTVSGATVTAQNAGTCTIAANQAGDGTFGTAPQVTNSINVAQASQTISFGAAPVLTFGTNGSVSATATSGLAVTFSSDTLAVCTVSGSTVTPVTAGSCIVRASQAGNTNFSAAQATQPINIAFASQSITFGAAPVLTFGGGTGSVSATATSGLTVSFSSGTPLVCSVSGSTVTPLAAGSCRIVASQAGNSGFAAATPVNQDFSIAKAVQVISFGAAPTLVAGASAQVNVTGGGSTSPVILTSNTPTICSVSNNTTVTGILAGTCSITANQATDANFSVAAPVSENFSVAATVPGVPTNVTAAPGNAVATVSFSAPLFTGGSDITSYTIVSNPAGGIDSTPGNATSHVITGLTNGTPYSFTVTAHNVIGAGAASAASNTVIPVTVPDPPTAVTAVASPESASVTFTPGFDGGHAITSYTVTSIPGGITASGASSPIVVAGLTDATAYTFTVTATSSVGTSLASAPSNSVTPFSTTHPVLVVSALADGSFTNNATLNVAGSVTSANGIASLTVNGTSVPVNANGTYSTAITLTTGANVITVIATDGSTQALQTSNARTINLDLTVPVITNLLPADNGITKNLNATVTGTVSETATVKISLNGATPVSAQMTGTNFSLFVGPFVEGINTILVNATDLAGNQTIDGSYKITVHLDTTAPSLSVTSPAQDIQLHTNTAPVTITGAVTDLSGVTVNLNFNGIDFPQVLTAGAFSQDITLPAEGSFPVVVTATDAAGNISTVTRHVIYTASPGDSSGAGGLTQLVDLVKATQFVYAQGTLTPAEIVRLDCAPLGPNGQPSPNGVVDAADIILLLRRVVGLVNF